MEPIIIKIQRRSWPGRLLQAPRLFCTILSVGRGRVPLRARIIAAALGVRTLLFARIGKE